MEMTWESGGVPPGAYSVEFVKLENFESEENSNDYGPAVILRFKVLSGDYEGEETTRICSKKMNPRTELGKFARAITGSQGKVGQSFRWEDFYGQAFQALVEETPSGRGTRVGSVVKAADSGKDVPAFMKE